MLSPLSPLSLVFRVFVDVIGVAGTSHVFAVHWTIEKFFVFNEASA